MLAMILTYTPIQAEGATVVEVSHSPDEPEAGQDVDITMKVDNATNITDVKMIFCTIDPFKCEFPVDMDQDSSDDTIFRYTITKDYDSGTKLGFKFKINYDNSTVQDFPESTANSDIHAVEGPFQGFYYFVFTLKSEPDNNIDILPWIVIIVLVVAIMPLIAAVLLWMKKRKGRKDEGEK